MVATSTLVARPSSAAQVQRLPRGRRPREGFPQIQDSRRWGMAAEKRRSGVQHGLGRTQATGATPWRESVLECVQRQLPLSPPPPRSRVTNPPQGSHAPRGWDSARGRGRGMSPIASAPATKAAADAARTPGRSAWFANRATRDPAGQFGVCERREGAGLTFTPTAPL